MVSAFILSCSDDRDKMYNDGAIVNLTLELSRKVGTTTRTDAGIDALNENVVYNIDLFLYKQGGALAGEQPVYAAYNVQITNYNDNTHQASISIPLPLNKYSTLFPNESVTSCDAYVVVNRPAASGSDNVYPKTDLSMPSIKGNTVVYSSTFQKRVQDGVTGKYHTTVQDNFVMDGYAEISRDNLSLTGTIPVERAAVKISLIIDGIKDKVADTEGKLWNANKDNVMLTLSSGMNRTHIGTMPQEYLYTPNKDTDLFDVKVVALNKEVGENITSQNPFYTYPTNWGTDEECRTYFILVVNWTRDDDSSISKTTYYEIPVNPAGAYLKRNSHYKILQKVEVLGSEDEETPVVLYPSNYVILDWGNTMTTDGNTNTETDAEINKLKFLVVDETTIEMNNTQSEQIYYFSSDPIEVTNIKVEWQNTKGNTSVTNVLANVANPTAVNGVYTVSNDGLKQPVKIGIHSGDVDNPEDRNYISFEHSLVNEMNSTSDYSEYIVTFDIQHVGDQKYSETIKITQYPMISIIADINSDYKNDSNNNNDNTNKGYVIIDNQNSNSNGTYAWKRVHGLAGSNKNPNRYIVSVASITEKYADKYIIGDPRSKTSKTYSGLSKDDNGKTTLEFYYPTNTADMTMQMIAPQFMVASSYGVCNEISLADAEKRCASYQEDGYPAGRWRIPTQAEIEYIVSLSAMKIIPVLFGTEGSDAEAKYWSANGAVVVKAKSGSVDSSTDTGDGPVRCVYDYWYWGDERVNKSTYTYGDKKR